MSKSKAEPRLQGSFTRDELDQLTPSTAVEREMIGMLRKLEPHYRAALLELISDVARQGAFFRLIKTDEGREQADAWIRDRAVQLAGVSP